MKYKYVADYMADYPVCTLFVPNTGHIALVRVSERKQDDGYNVHMAVCNPADKWDLAYGMHILNNKVANQGGMFVAPEEGFRTWPAAAVLGLARHLDYRRELPYHSVVGIWAPYILSEEEVNRPIKERRMVETIVSVCENGKVSHGTRRLEKMTAIFEKVSHAKNLARNRWIAKQAEQLLQARDIKHGIAGAIGLKKWPKGMPDLRLKTTY